MLKLYHIFARSATSLAKPYRLCEAQHCLPKATSFCVSQGGMMLTYRSNNVASKLANDVVSCGHKHKKIKTIFRWSLFFCHSYPKKNWVKTEDYSNSLPQCGQYFENHGSFQKNVSQCGQRHQKYSKMQNKIKKIIRIDTPNPVVVKNLYNKIIANANNAVIIFKIICLVLNGSFDCFIKSPTFKCIIAEKRQGDNNYSSTGSFNIHYSFENLLFV